MSFLTNALKKLTNGISFSVERLVFEDITVVTTALLAEGGYSYVYCAKESSSGRVFAAKKVLAQDAETRQVAEVETRVLQQLTGQAGFVQCFGATCKTLARGHREYWMLLEFCPNGSLIDLLFKKVKGGAYEKREHMSEARVLEIFEAIVAPIVHMHSLSPPITHRDLKLENVLGTADGRYVLCDFGSAVTTTLPAERTRKEVIVEEERIQKYSTLMYRAPEMVDLYRNQEVGVKTDVWALGCILFSLCFHDHPFGEESSLQILNAAYTIPVDSPHSPRMHKLIRALLEPNPAIRPAAADVLAAVRKLRAALSGLPAAKTPNAAPAGGQSTRAPSQTKAVPPPPEWSANFDADFAASSDFKGADFGEFGDATAAQSVGRPVRVSICTNEVGEGSEGHEGTVRRRLVHVSLTLQDSAEGWHASFCDEPPATDGAAGFVATFDDDPTIPPPPPAVVPAPQPAATLAVRAAAPSTAADEDEFGEFSCGSESERSLRRESFESPDGPNESFGDFEGAGPQEEASKTDEPRSMRASRERNRDSKDSFGDFESARSPQQESFGDFESASAESAPADAAASASDAPAATPAAPAATPVAALAAAPVAAPAAASDTVPPAASPAAADSAAASSATGDMAEGAESSAESNLNDRSASSEVAQAQAAESAAAKGSGSAEGGGDDPIDEFGSFQGKASDEKEPDAGGGDGEDEFGAFTASPSPALPMADPGVPPA